MRKLIISSSDSYYFQVNAGFSTFRAIARGARGRVEDKLKERGPFTIFMPASEIHLEFKGTVHQLSSRVMEFVFFRQLKEHLKEICERKQMNPKKCDGVQCPKTVGRMDVYGRTDSTMQKEEHV